MNSTNFDTLLRQAQNLEISKKSNVSCCSQFSQMGLFFNNISIEQKSTTSGQIFLSQNGIDLSRLQRLIDSFKTSETTENQQKNQKNNSFEAQTTLFANQQLNYLSFEQMQSEWNNRFQSKTFKSSPFQNVFSTDSENINSNIQHMQKYSYYFNEIWNRHDPAKIEFNIIFQAMALFLDASDDDSEIPEWKKVFEILLALSNNPNLEIPKVFKIYFKKSSYNYSFLSDYEQCWAYLKYCYDQENKKDICIYNRYKENLKSPVEEYFHDKFYIFCKIFYNYENHSIDDNPFNYLHDIEDPQDEEQFLNLLYLTSLNYFIPRDESQDQSRQNDIDNIIEIFRDIWPDSYTKFMEVFNSSSTISTKKLLHAGIFYLLIKDYEHSFQAISQLYNTYPIQVTNFCLILINNPSFTIPSQNLQPIIKRFVHYYINDNNNAILCTYYLSQLPQVHDLILFIKNTNGESTISLSHEKFNAAESMIYNKLDLIINSCLQKTYSTPKELVDSRLLLVKIALLTSETSTAISILQSLQANWILLSASDAKIAFELTNSLIKKLQSENISSSKLSIPSLSGQIATLNSNEIRSDKLSRMNVMMNVFMLTALSRYQDLEKDERSDLYNEALNYSNLIEQPREKNAINKMCKLALTYDLIIDSKFKDAWETLKEIKFWNADNTKISDNEWIRIKVVAASELIRTVVVELLYIDAEKTTMDDDNRKELLQFALKLHLQQSDYEKLLQVQVRQ